MRINSGRGHRLPATSPHRPCPSCGSEPGRGVGRSEASDAHFPPTEWTLVIEAARAPSPNSAAALESLCRAYWPAIYAFLRRHGSTPSDAQDLTQEFILCLLRRHSLASVDPAKGRFRSFLLGALKHFLADEQRKLHAQKCIDSHIAFSLDAIDAETCFSEPASNLTPEETFDRCWALRLLDQSLCALRKEQVAAGRLAQFEVLKEFLTADTTYAAYETAAPALGMKPRTVAVAVHRLRRRFRQLVRAQAARTLSHPADLEDELRSLFG